MKVQIVIISLVLVAAFLGVAYKFSTQSNQIQSESDNVAVSHLVRSSSLSGPQPCVCDADSCGCCVTGIPLINSVCANITWSAGTLTIEVVIQVNGITVYDKSFTDPSNPLQVCISVGCEVCVFLANLNVTDTGACGNVDIGVKCFGFKGAWDLGAFNIGSDCTIPELALAAEEFKKKYTSNER